MDPFEIVITDPKSFPVKIFESDFLSQANASFNFVP